MLLQHQGLQKTLAPRQHHGAFKKLDTPASVRTLGHSSFGSFPHCLTFETGKKGLKSSTCPPCILMQAPLRQCHKVAVSHAQAGTMQPQNCDSHATLGCAP